MDAVTTQELTRKFGDFTAVDRLTINIRAGEICGFLGPNGAGKSTAVRMLCGILEPTSGSSRVLGFDLARETEEIKSRIGYMSQKFSLYEDLTVSENLEFFAGLYSLPKSERGGRIREMVELAGLTGREGELVASLSSGWKQRLALGSALISRPSIIFLDEPTSGVSPTGRREFFNIIQQLANAGTTVIVTTHFMDEAERCNKIVFFSEGRLVAMNTPEYLKSHVLKGYLVEVDLPDPMGQIQRIEAQPYVRECNLNGSLLHVLLRSRTDVSALQTLTRGTVTPITPTLDDVFIALVREKRQEESADE